MDNAGLPPCQSHHDLAECAEGTEDGLDKMCGCATISISGPGPWESADCCTMVSFSENVVLTTMRHVGSPGAGLGCRFQALQNFRNGAVGSGADGGRLSEVLYQVRTEEYSTRVRGELGISGRIAVSRA